jgi:hypothetical protein
MSAVMPADPAVRLEDELLQVLDALQQRLELQMQH